MVTTSAKKLADAILTAHIGVMKHPFRPNEDRVDVPFDEFQIIRKLAEKVQLEEESKD